jgi:RNA ligase (TIGR02306 family)
MAYSAIIARVSTRPHPNADRLQLGTCHGYQVVVSKDTLDGTLGIFFPTDGQISKEYAAANDLIGYTDPETGERRGGFFGKNRRVRSQRFRGEKSDGYWAPLSSLDFAGDTTSLAEGHQLTEFNGVPICNKYYTPATLRAMKSGRGLRRQNNLFAKHVDTAQLKHEIDSIVPNTLVWTTEKLHGTSGRFGYVLDEKIVPQKWWQKLLRRPQKRSAEYTHLLGTRNTILADHTAEGFYGNEEFRWNAIKNLVGNLHKGEILYFELVGYTTTGEPIMSQHDTSDLSDEMKKKYGKTITYKYNQPEGTCGLYVYRITRTNEDGDVVELPWTQVKRRCRELGVYHVPEIPEDLIANPNLISIYHNPSDSLMLAIDDLLEGDSLLDSSHIREGVCLRLEEPDGSIRFLKSKSFSFGLMEGYLKNTDDYVDLEEAS